MLKITQQKRNELLQREEISALEEGFKAPTMNETKTELASLLRKNEELITIKRIKGRFGSRQFVIEAYAYDTPEVMRRIEPGIREKKSKGKEVVESATEKTEQAKTSEAKPEEKKTEENKKE